METIRFFSVTQANMKKEEATPMGEEIRVFMDGPEDVCAIMGADMPEETAAAWSASMPTALGNLAADLDGMEEEISWLKEGPVHAVVMSQKTVQAEGVTPIDALINLAKNILGLDWEPNLEA